MHTWSRGRARGVTTGRRALLPMLLLLLQIVPSVSVVRPVRPATPSDPLHPLYPLHPLQRPDDLDFEAPHPPRPCGVVRQELPGGHPTHALRSRYVIATWRLHDRYTYGHYNRLQAGTDMMYPNAPAALGICEYT